VARRAGSADRRLASLAARVKTRSHGRGLARVDVSGEANAFAASESSVDGPSTPPSSTSPACRWAPETVGSILAEIGWRGNGPRTDGSTPRGTATGRLTPFDLTQLLAGSTRSAPIRRRSLT
jgi:hypothetical protein